VFGDKTKEHAAGILIPYERLLKIENENMKIDILSIKL